MTKETIQPARGTFVQIISERNPFSIIGRLNMKETDPERNGKDILELFEELTPKAMRLFNTIKQNTSYKNNVSYVPPEKTPFIHETNRNKFVKELTVRMLVKKVPVSKGKELNFVVPKHCYVMNPDIIQPPNEFLERTQEIWNNV